MRHLFYILSVGIIFGFASCEKFEGDQTVPAYLYIDKISLVENPDLSSQGFEQDSGFLSSDINTVEIIVNKSHKVGVFELPCTIPVLQGGNSEVLVYPCVKQNGMSATRIRYPFYQSVTQNTNLVPGETQTLNISAQYKNAPSYFLRTENFEKASHEFDTVLKFCPNEFTAEGVTIKYGKKCGIIFVPADVSVISTVIEKKFNFASLANAFYLELDYASTTPFRVGLSGYGNTGYLEYTALELYPTNGEWKKVYINLGKVWGQMNLDNKDFQIKFWAFNRNNSSNAWVCIDNVKVMKDY